ncbi:hypothetical protein [Tardisphaera saccharovorans]
MELKNLSFGGFSVDIPSEWEVSAIRISNNETVLGIQDLEKARLEVRWQEANWKKTKEEARARGKALTKKLLEPEEVAENYHKEIKKKIKDMEFDEGISHERIGGHSAVISKWYGGGLRGYDAIWYCGTSDRYYYLRYTDGDDYGAFKSILSSVSCHSSLSTLTWRYLGLDLQLPRDYRLDVQKAEVGRLIAVFLGHWEIEGKKRGTLSWLRPPPLPPVRKLIIEKVNLIRFGNSDLASWTAQEAATLTGKYVGSARVRFGPVEVNVNGHEGYLVLLSVGGGLLRGMPQYLSAYGWKCAQSSSAYVLVVPLSLREDWRKKVNDLTSPPNYVRCHSGYQETAGDSA